MTDIGEVYGAIVAAGASWFWDTIGKELASKAVGAIKDRFKSFKWLEAEEHYRSRLREQHRFTRLLGNPKLIELENIYTDVYILDQPSALRRYSLKEMQDTFQQKSNKTIGKEKRHALLKLVVTKKRLYLLGKPGAGKTTFLRYLTLQACAGKIQETPIFVELKDWAASGLELMDYLARQFEICAFTNTEEVEVFIKYLLEHGHALVLFDGLDEVNQASNQRANMIRELKDFARKYPVAHICLTCRIAASDYTFEQFTYLEIADFTDQQVQLFAKKWYQGERGRSQRFSDELNKPEHEGLKELTRTPLLLALLCLAYDQSLEFPSNRTDLYKEAFDALLKKWDASREIRRDILYQNLTVRRKENMLARIAAENFDKSRYFIPSTHLANQISSYLKQVPGVETSDEIDGELILRAIEAQHGILVERAHGIYSFSHLTFQEYLTAKYITENMLTGALERLIRNHFTDDRWREVFLMTACLLDDASNFFEIFIQAINNSLRKKPTSAILHWAYEKAQPKLRHNGKTCNEVILLTLYYTLSFTLLRTLSLACENTEDLENKLARCLALTRKLDLNFLLDFDRDRSIGIDRYLVLAHEIGFAREIDLSYARVLAHARTRTCDLILALNPALNIVLNIDRDIETKMSVIRNIDIELMKLLSRVRELTSDLDSEVARILAQSPNRDLDRDLVLIHELSRYVDHARAPTNYIVDNLTLVIDGIRSQIDKAIKDADMNYDIQLPSEANDLTTEIEQAVTNDFLSYINANSLLYECLKLSVVSNREGILARMFIPPTD